jgi:hypothetical protein
MRDDFDGRSCGKIMKRSISIICVSEGVYIGNIHSSHFYGKNSIKDRHLLRNFTAVDFKLLLVSYLHLHRRDFE